MAVKTKPFVSKRAITLGLCTAGILAAVMFLINLSPVTSSSAYRPAAASAAKPVSAAGRLLPGLALNNSSGQSAGQSSPGSNSEVLGISTNSDINTPASSTPQSTPTSPPTYNYTQPTPPPAMPPSHDVELGPLYPTDPIPCKFSNPGIKVSCNYCADTVSGISCGCRGYQGADIACLAQ